MWNRNPAAILILICALALSSCDQAEKKKPGNLLESQKKAMEKAKAVEEQLQNAAERQRKEIQEQTGSE